MPSAALCFACSSGVNLPLALITTLYSNPPHHRPLYVAAFAIGSLMSGNGAVAFIPPPDFAGFDPLRWAADLAAWAGGWAARWWSA